MGKKNMYTRHLNDENDEVNELGQVFPRCIWGFGFVHIDYHHWRSNLKRMLLQKMNPRKRIKGKASAKELHCEVGEQQKLLTEDEKRFPSAKESGKKQKSSLKARIKSLMAEDISKEQRGNQRGSSVSSQAILERTYSFHHLQPPDHRLPEVCTDWESPIFFFSNGKDIGATKLWDLKNMSVVNKPDGHGKKSKEVKKKDTWKDEEHANVLEIFKANKHLFLESLQDGSKLKARLTKSGSYPAARLVQKREPEPSTLKQKQSEIWPAPKGEKLNNVNVIPKVEKFNYSMHSRSKSLPSFRGGKLGQALNFILETTTESGERRGEGEVPISDIESKKSVQFGDTDGGDKVSNGCDSSVVEDDSDKRSGEGQTCSVDRNSSFSSLENVEHGSSQLARFHRRSSSLNESLDKYARLFGNDFGKEVNLGPSRSLKLRNEHEMGLGGGAPILFGRIRSLSHLESYSSIQDVAHGDANLEDWSITIEKNGRDNSCQEELKDVELSPSSEEVVPRGDIQEPIKEYEILETVDNISQMTNLPVSTEMCTTDSVSVVEDLEEEADLMTDGKSISLMEQASISSPIAPNEFSQESSTPEAQAETDFKEQVFSCSAEFQDSEGLEAGDDHYDINSSINYGKEEVSSLLPSSLPNLEKLDEMKKDAKLGEIDKKHDANLDYVKLILEYSGFAKDALQKTWYSSSQPLGPSVFLDIEAYWHKELECCREDYLGCQHHQLLFDIMNEKLLNIYDRSFTYYPKALSASCYIRPFPMGNRILDEICGSISTLTSLKAAQKQSLECIVGLDIGKDDGWMNLQLESECLALEVEDSLFDELMEDLEDMIFEQVFGS